LQQRGRAASCKYSFCPPASRSCKTQCADSSPIVSSHEPAAAVAQIQQSGRDTLIDNPRWHTPQEMRVDLANFARAFVLITDRLHENPRGRFIKLCGKFQEQFFPHRARELAHERAELDSCEAIIKADFRNARAHAIILAIVNHERRVLRHSLVGTDRRPVRCCDRAFSSHHLNENALYTSASPRRKLAARRACCWMIDRI